MAVITRQYAPPTCTLEVTAQTSALSRWTRQPVLKSLDFLLSFNELCDRNQQPLEVQGNQEQLESLSEAVSAYTQEFLGQSLVPLPDERLRSEPSQAEPEVQTADLSGEAAATVTLPVPLHLRPRNLLSHELVLGSLATEASGAVIQLKASQLFDLATALDEYGAEIETLPAQVPQPARPSVPVWARAAGVILLVGGTTAALSQFLYTGFGGPTSTISQKDQESTSQETAPVANLPSPAVPSPTLDEAPLPQPTQALPTVKLPKRDFGDSKTNPFPASLRPSNSQSAPSASQPIAKPKAAQQAPLAKLPSLPEPPAPVDLNLEQLKEPKTTDAPTTIAGRPPIELGQTNIGRSGTSAASESLKSSDVLKSSPQAGVSAESEASFSTADVEKVPQLEQAKPAAPAAVSPGAPVPPESQARNRTAFDVTPQIAEARQYLAQRWQVPANLKQTLQYTLVLNADGTIGQIKPRGQAATQYLGQTPIPETNQPFVSPTPASGKKTIRVVLGADGSVLTFPESSPSD